MREILILLIVGLIVMVTSLLVIRIIPESNNSLVIKTTFILTLICMYLFWMIAYLAQINPMFYPTIKTH